MARTTKTSKKSTTDKIDKKEIREVFSNCRIHTQDQVRNAIAEICRREGVSDDTTKKLSSVLEIVVSDSISRFMASSGV